MEDSSGFCAARSVVWAFEEVVGFGMMLLVAEVSLVVATRYSGGAVPAVTLSREEMRLWGNGMGWVEFVKRKRLAFGRAETPSAWLVFGTHECVPFRTRSWSAE
jgi:hypothetical protein